MKVIDDFLSPSEYEQVRDYLLGTDIKWKFNDNKVTPGDGQIQFTHRCFEPQRFPVTIERTMKELDPIWAKLCQEHNLDVMLRVKINMEPRTAEHIESLFHTDTLQHNTTAVYYVNTNNGCTRFKDGTKVDSVANRMVIFDAQTQHGGVTCTDEHVRVVININYFEKAVEKDKGYYEELP